jgi:hypothetical protein
MEYRSAEGRGERFMDLAVRRNARGRAQDRDQNPEFFNIETSVSKIW